MRLRTWRELLSDAGDRADILAPLGESGTTAVTMPTTGVTMAPDELVRRLATQGKVILPCSGWAPWASCCLVCHWDTPPGQATTYAHLYARVCTDYCSDLVGNLERIRDRSVRGRWRPTAQVRAMANGALCNACMAAAGGADE